MFFSAIIVAGGKGKRFGTKEPKQFLSLAKKKMFVWSILAFKKVKECRQIILVVPEYKLPEMEKYKKLYNIDVVPGGKERYDSVKNGLKCVKENIDFVAVHDAARPLVTSEPIKEVFSSAVKYGGAIAASPAKDSIKFSKDGKFISNSIDRKNIWQAQTPQIFKIDLLKRVYSKKISKNVTDDAQLMEKIKSKVALVDCGYENFKVTQKIDFKLAELILQRR